MLHAAADVPSRRRIWRRTHPCVRHARGPGYTSRSRSIWRVMKHVDVAIAVVARGADVLICRRPEGVPFAGYWEFPGGKLEPGETLAQCVVRELAEEVGATVAPESALPIIEHA